MWYLILLLIIIFILSVLVYCFYLKANTSLCVSSRHLVGKVVLVTGGTSGIGYETAVDLAERGARVLIASNERHGDSVRDTIVARSGNTDVYFIYLDLTSLESVRSVANDIIAKEKRLDILINNAGVFLPKRGLTEDGLTVAMQINYFGPFLLTNLLLPIITKTPSSRIVNVSSKLYRFGSVDLERLNEPRSGCLPSFLAYCDSKLCVALMTVELARRLHGTGVRDNIVARSGNTDVYFIYLDLTSLESVRSVANDIIAKEKRLDILINNAGVFLPKRGLTEDGLTVAMQINYFGPFLLTNLLLPIITKTPSSRIVNVSSKLYRFGSVDLERLNEPRSGCLPSFLAYCDSKLCVALMTVELARRLHGTGVTANFLHPGCSRTNIYRYDTFVKKVAFQILLLKYFLKTPREAAQTTIHLAVSAEVEKVSGCYFRNCKIVKLPGKVRNSNLAKQLWNVSNEFVNLSA